MSIAHSGLQHHVDEPLQTGVPLEFSTEDGATKILGFWLFMVTDVLLFACLFATYVVLYKHIGAGASAAKLFGDDVSGFTAETFILLTSSFTCGLATYEMRHGSHSRLKLWIVITMLLGLSFIGLEVYEFSTFVSHGDTMSTSAFLSAFFTLVGTHGAHVSLGIIWMGLILYQISRRGVNPVTARKLFIVSLYWHFLDVVWVFIFTVVYLTGVM
ncbi:cytochrome (ubi)quinol oxidase subunit III [Alicyclobacillus ferrooxydans]|uniref:Cytochrome o ubiquinol oxidase subunit III n=1 Tax=Alicyclobacillus ferrooxydans TaxID=471514 RepID=A0A0N8PPM8_9BACL|nr:cytochrome (ubi)quinol oxidase subunit III [Alicyclobacillus ferrooxydans]KPV44765.1 cytochrome o ubiquinol oxidase subunit III [Alicyclobacillus ferrooxydans]